MGITGQGSCLFSSIPLQSTDIYHVVHGQYKLNTSTSTTTTTTTTATTNNDNNNTTTTRNRPRVVIDANPVAYRFIFKYIGPVRYIMLLYDSSLVDNSSILEFNPLGCVSNL